MYKNKTGLTFACLVAFLLLSAGCTNTPVALDSPDHAALLKQDQDGFADTQPDAVVKLTLDEAIDRAVKANLDGRVAEMEILVQQRNVTLKELEALPSMTASRGIKRRSNDGATSSRSVISGLQSLEPSQSSDEKRFVSEATASWDIMNAGVTLAEVDRMNDETQIARERYAKVIQNIERDTYAAYWRAWAYQQTHKGTLGALGSSRAQIGNLETAVDRNLLSTDEGGDKIAEIAGRMRTLEETSAQLNLSQTELKTLLSLPQSARLELAPPPRESSAIATLLAGNTIDQEWEALKSRPEMREEVLQKNVAIKNIHHEILKTFPGGEILFSYNNDSNSFLQDNEWNNFSLSIVQNLLNILTLPARYKAAQERENLADARRKALNAAIVAQVYLGKIRLNEAKSVWSTARASSDAAYKKARAKKAKQKTGFASGNDAVLAELESQIETLRRYVAEAEMQDSYAALLNTLGRSLSKGKGAGA